jgi:hypothetical protein
VSDEPPALPAPSSRFVFASEELTRFFAAKWKIQRCEICDVADWGMESERSLSCLPTSDGIVISTISETVTLHLRINCNSCGNCKFLLASVVRRWLDENR